MTVDEQVAIDEQQLMGFVFRAVGEVGAALNCALVVMGDRLGYYRALAERGPLAASELAELTATGEKYAREWLDAQAAGSYVDYDPATGTYTLSAEHAVALTDESSPAFLPGLFQFAFGTIRDAGRVMDLGPQRGRARLARARTRRARGLRAVLPARLPRATWSTAGCRRSTAWSPSSQRGARVADVGCGFGASTILMAQAFPALDLRRLGLPRGLDRRGPRPGGRAPASPTGRRSRSLPPRASAVGTTTW